MAEFKIETRLDLLARGEMANEEGREIIGFPIIIGPIVSILDVDFPEHTADQGDLFLQFIPVKPESIDKCTGIRDLDGNLLFERDLVRDITNRRMEIVWMDPDKKEHMKGMFLFQALSKTNFQYAHFTSWWNEKGKCLNVQKMIKADLPQEKPAKKKKATKRKKKNG